MKNERNLEDKFIDDLKALNYEYIDKDQMFDLRKGEKKTNYFAFYFGTTTRNNKQKHQNRWNL
ncbi:unknown; predicted coding region [Mycoplasmopsis pulmonis]|uniref:Uncharacterized protein n=1 Tax=Mycoplasmopsis pulmonis (strain UAB CTIP) TaxID=272635 RepID=Q98RD3_MYCPU|nr:hypothetical protein [Mycoplasmopsis pulmonis]CAC13249.1 unknown; predicted coding region [Mycoplasmopsis pulmonis]